MIEITREKTPVSLLEKIREGKVLQEYGRMRENETE